MTSKHTAREALIEAELHRQTAHLDGPTCWQCEPRKTFTGFNHYLALVEDPALRCPWCDGTGWFLYATWLDSRGNEFRPCGQCKASGRKP